MRTRKKRPCCTNTAPAARAAAGNILLYVLIGIVLFAAFMFMITRGNQGRVDTTERTAMDAQQITSYAQKLYGAVQSVMLQNDCRATQVDFDNNKVSGYAGSGLSKCQVFNLSGGGMDFSVPPAEAVDTASATAAGSALAGNYIFEGNVCVENQGTGPATANGAACSAANAEILFIMPWVTEAVCEQLNEITRNTTAIPTVTSDAFDGTKFTGTFASDYTISLPYRSVCFESTGNTNPPGTGYHFYEVLDAQ